jgi:predicted lipoprotein with Yx(FWY)xxD motif
LLASGAIHLDLYLTGYRVHPDHRLSAPDTATRSACDESCTAYWPPVKGPAKAGPGVTGMLSVLTRSDGSVQVAYDRHPLYTYVGDSAPGQANGNGLDLNGGLWHEVTVSG